MIKKMFALSKKGTSFDFMTTYVDFTQPRSFHMDPKKIYHFCHQNITPRLNIINDYMMYEFVVHLYNETKSKDHVFKNLNSHE